jgi:hypothetical protein
MPENVQSVGLFQGRFKIQATVVGNRPVPPGSFHGG